MHWDSSIEAVSGAYLISHAFFKHSERINKTGTCGVTKNVPFLKCSNYMHLKRHKRVFHT